MQSDQLKPVYHIDFSWLLIAHVILCTVQSLELSNYTDTNWDRTNNSIAPTYQTLGYKQYAWVFTRM